MPIEYRIDKSRRRLLARIHGEFTFAEILKTIEAATQDPDFEPGFDILDDHTGIDRAITIEEAKMLAEWLTTRAGRLAGARWAVVTRRIDSYGTMRMLSALADRMHLQIQVFTTFEAAEAWLESDRLP